jgi:serine/threonine protein kinase
VFGRRRSPQSTGLSLPGFVDVTPLASGGASTVYRARQPEFDRDVAVKVLSAPVHDERLRRRFERELAVAGRLSSHPNVVTVHAAGFTHDARPYVVMELCPAGSLADELDRNGPLPVAEVVRTGVRIAGAMATAHAGGVVHRDVKPANVLRTTYGEPALADFGIATVTDEGTAATEALTPVHAAPEVLEGRPATVPSDIWSLGSTLWTLLAGSPPFAARPGDGVLGSMLRIINDPVPPLPRADVPAEVREVIERALDKDPARRWQSATEFGEALAAAGARVGAPVEMAVAAAADALPAPLAPPTPGDGESTRLGRPRPPDATPAPRRSLTPYVVGGSIAIVAVAVAVVALLSRNSNDSPAPQPTPTTSVDLHRLAPAHVHVVRDNGSSVVLAWTDPSNGRFAYVVDDGVGPVSPARSRTRTVVAGLSPGRGYCFSVGAVYSLSARPAYANPVCVRGGRPGG